MKKTKNNENKGQSYWNGVVIRFRKNKLAVVCFFILLSLITCCVVVPMVSTQTMYSTDMGNIKQAPTKAHILGTDDIGRDLLVRLFYGGRVSLGIALAVTFLECVIGVLLGSIAGYYGGLIDTIIMRICDVFSSFPFLIICITVVAVFGNSVLNLILVLGLLSWPSIAMIVRGQILTLRELEYMEACEALGISDMRRIMKHLLPNVMAYVIVYATLGMASVILTETSLSFVGLGVNMPMPSWGNMIQAARNLSIIQNRWWYWIPPGISIFITVMCFNIVGDGLRDAIDPKMKR